MKRWRERERELSHHVAEVEVPFVKMKNLAGVVKQLRHLRELRATDLQRR
jgi:hypothetical protein